MADQRLVSHSMLHRCQSALLLVAWMVSWPLVDRRTAKPSRREVQDGEDWLQERELLDQYGKIGRATKAAA